MNRQSRSATRLATALVILGMVAVACGRQGAPQGAPSASQAPAAAASGGDAAAATDSPATIVDASETPGSPAASDSAAPGATYSPPSIANDPVTGEMQTIDQLINGINGSLSGSNSGE